MHYNKFEDLPCWNKARELSQVVFEMIGQPAFRKDFILKDQVWKACGSLTDTIAGGFDSGSNRELIRLLGYAQRSCSEVQSQLYRALDCTYITQAQFEKVSASVAECRQQITGFRKYAQSRPPEKPEAKTSQSPEK